MLFAEAKQDRSEAQASTAALAFLKLVTRAGKTLTGSPAGGLL